MIKTSQPWYRTGRITVGQAEMLKLLGLPPRVKIKSAQFTVHDAAAAGPALIVSWEETDYRTEVLEEEK